MTEKTQYYCQEEKEKVGTLITRQVVPLQTNDETEEVFLCRRWKRLVEKLSKKGPGVEIL